jgi:hypothetical protein
MSVLHFQEVIEDAPVDSHQRDAAQEGGTLPSETAVQFDDAVGPEFPEDPGFDMEMPEGEGTAMEPFTAFQEGDDLAASPMPSDKYADPLQTTKTVSPTRDSQSPRLFILKGAPVARCISFPFIMKNLGGRH